MCLSWKAETFMKILDKVKIYFVHGIAKNGNWSTESKAFGICIFTL